MLSVCVSHDDGRGCFVAFERFSEQEEQRLHNPLDFATPSYWFEWPIGGRGSLKASWEDVRHMFEEDFGVAWWADRKIERADLLRKKMEKWIVMMAWKFRTHQKTLTKAMKGLPVAVGGTICKGKWKMDHVTLVVERKQRMHLLFYDYQQMLRYDIHSKWSAKTKELIYEWWKMRWWDKHKVSTQLWKEKWRILQILFTAWSVRNPPRNS